MRIATVGVVFACTLATATAVWFVEPAAVRSAGQTFRTFDLEETTVRSLLRDQQSGRRTARQVVEQYLSRIQALDRSGPSLAAIIELNPDALVIADTLDAERRASGIRGPLHGIPLVIKDNIDTADHMSTTAGSLALEGSIAARDAFIVDRLRAAGAIILGKSNMSEWANFRSLHSTSGWSGRGGLVRNPYALDRSACGSSSGTAAAIAASFATIGVGTETDGSIICPSAATALVGIKPTVGLVSRSGIVPIAHSQDTAGPMARTVEDAAILLEVLAAVDEQDRATMDPSRPTAVAYRAALDANGLRGARIGVARAKFFGYSDATDQIANAAIKRMSELGAIIIDPADIPNAGTYDQSEMDVLLYEFKADLDAYLGALGPASKAHSLADIIAFNEANRTLEMPFFGQELMLEAQKKGALTDAAYLAAVVRNATLSRKQGIDAVMDRLHLDALVAPSGSPPWTIDLVNGDHFVGSSTTPAAVAGYPSITVPAGYAVGLPVGISFIGRRWSEAQLIKYAYAYEQATKHRRVPTFAETANVGVDSERHEGEEARPAGR